MAEPTLKSPNVEVVAPERPGTRPPEEPAHRFAPALIEAMQFEAGGEVVVRAGDRTGRAYVCAGRVAWITASTQQVTLTDVLIAECRIAPADLKAVYAECKRTGANFAETLVDWALLSRDAMHDALRRHVARALAEILSWHEARVFVVPTVRSYRSNMTFTAAELLDVAAQIAPAALVPIVVRIRDELLDVKLAPSAPPPDGPRPAQLDPPPHDDARRVPTKEKRMALESYLTELKEVKGYKAAGIMHFTGEMLASDWTGTEVDVNLVGATFNDIFRSAHEACGKIGLDACTEQVINTPKGQVIMRCSGVHAKAHFHMLCILTADGNQALAKMRIEKMVPKIMDELA